MVSHFAKEYRRLGHDVTVLTTTNNRSQQGLEHWNGLRVHRVYVSPYPERWRAYLSLCNPWVVKFAYRVLLQEKPDALHAHNVHYYLSYHLLKMAANIGIPVGLTLHDVMAVDFGKFTQGIPLHDLSDRPHVDYRVHPWHTFRVYKFRYFPWRNAFIRRYVHRFVQARVAVSQELRCLLETNGVRCTHVIHNGLDPDEWRTNPEQLQELRDRLGLQGRKVFLFGGRLGYWKGARQIVKALPIIVRAVPEAVLLVLGHVGRETRTMQALAEDLGVRRHLAVAGWLEGRELVAAYGISDVVVIPSLCFDSFPTAVLEAMATRKPVVATCFGGAKEAMVHRETGFLVNPLNLESLAQPIITLLQDERKAQCMGEAGYERLVERFTLQRCALNYLELFNGRKSGKSDAMPTLTGAEKSLP